MPLAKINVTMDIVTPDFVTLECDTALIEYIRPNDEGEWEMNVLDGQDYATNMYMSEGWETFGVDKDFSKQYSFEL